MPCQKDMFVFTRNIRAMQQVLVERAVIPGRPLDAEGLDEMRRLSNRNAMCAECMLGANIVCQEKGRENEL